MYCIDIIHIHTKSKKPPFSLKWWPQQNIFFIYRAPRHLCLIVRIQYYNARYYLETPYTASALLENFLHAHAGECQQIQQVLPEYTKTNRRDAYLLPTF